MSAKSELAKYIDQVYSLWGRPEIHSSSILAREDLAYWKARIPEILEFTQDDVPLTKVVVGLQMTRGRYPREVQTSLCALDKKTAVPPAERYKAVANDLVAKLLTWRSDQGGDHGWIVRDAIRAEASGQAITTEEMRQLLQRTSHVYVGNDRSGDESGEELLYGRLKQLVALEAISLPDDDTIVPNPLVRRLYDQGIGIELIPGALKTQEQEEDAQWELSKRQDLATLLAQFRQTK